jgi:hypothetical protein
MAQVMFFEAAAEGEHQMLQPAGVEADQKVAKREQARNTHLSRPLWNRYPEADVTHFLFFFVGDHASVVKGRCFQEPSHITLHVSNVHATKADELETMPQ